MNASHVLTGAGALLGCVMLLGQAALSGCRQSSGKVRPVNLPPGRVKVVEVRLQYEPLTITDPAIIAACVAEVNALSCTPYRPAKLSRSVPQFAFKDDQDEVLLEVGTGPYITIWEPESEPFFVYHETMPTLGKAYAYVKTRKAHRSLVRLSEMSKWDADNVSSLEFALYSYASWGPQGPLTMPDTPADLRKSLPEMPPLTLQELDKFDDPFD